MMRHDSHESHDTTERNDEMIEITGCLPTLSSEPYLGTTSDDGTPEKLILDAVGAKAGRGGRGISRERNEPIDLIVPSTAHRRHHHHQVMMNVACECMGHPHV